MKEKKKSEKKTQKLLAGRMWRRETRGKELVPDEMERRKITERKKEN